MAHPSSQLTNWVVTRSSSETAEAPSAPTPSEHAPTQKENRPYGPTLAATSTAQARTSSASWTGNAEGPSPGNQSITETTSRLSHYPTASQLAATVSRQ